MNINTPQEYRSHCCQCLTFTASSECGRFKVSLPDLMGLSAANVGTELIPGNRCKKKIKKMKII